MGVNNIYAQTHLHTYNYYAASYAPASMYPRVYAQTKLVKEELYRYIYVHALTLELYKWTA